MITHYALCYKKGITVPLISSLVLVPCMPHKIVITSVQTFECNLRQIFSLLWRWCPQWCSQIWCQLIFQISCQWCSCILCICKWHFCKYISWRENYEHVSNQYATLLSTQCGCVRWVVLLPLSGCLGVYGRLSGWQAQMKDMFSSHLGTGGLTGWLHHMINDMIATADRVYPERLYNFD